MYPFIKLVIVWLTAKKRPPLSVTDTDESDFFCMPWDIDLFGEMNNGRILTLYDLGRFSLALRCGLIDILRKKRWGLVVAGSSVQYRKRIRMFQKYTIKTTFVDYDDRWIFIQQSMWVKGVPTSSAILRTAVTNKGKAIPVSEVTQALNIKKPAFNHANDWVENWIALEKKRHFPDVTQ